MLKLEVGQEYYDGNGQAVKIIHKGLEVEEGRVYYLGVAPGIGAYGMAVSFYYESGRRVDGSESAALQVFDWTQLKMDDLVEVGDGAAVARRYVDRVSREEGLVYLFSDGVTSKTFDPARNRRVYQPRRNIRRVIERSPEPTPASP